MSTDIGYIYRVASANAQQLQAIIDTHVGDGLVFGGAAQWDFDTDTKNNLRYIQAFISPIAADMLRGDFGHAFSKEAEVRWKRRDDGSYDVLILSEQPRAIPDAAPLIIPVWNTQTTSWEDGVWYTRSFTTAAVRQRDGRSIAYIDYLAPNGAAQFQRLVEVKS